MPSGISTKAIPADAGAGLRAAAWAAWAVLGLGAALLAACAGTEGAKAPQPPKLVANAHAKSIYVSEVNAGADVTLESTQPLVVSLTLDVSAPQEWSLVDLKPGVLSIVSTRFERTTRDSALGEFGGLMIWTLKPVAPGTVTLDFDLRRPHSLLPATKSISYRVVVK